MNYAETESEAFIPAEVPEQYRDLYVEKDGEFVLDADGVEDVTGLKNALERQKKERQKKERQKALEELHKFQEQFKDIDPEKARQPMNLETAFLAVRDAINAIDGRPS